MGPRPDVQITAAEATRQTALDTRLFINGKVRTPKLTILPYSQKQYVEAAKSTRMSCYSTEDGTLITADVHKATESDIDNAVAALATRSKTGLRQCPPRERNVFSGSPI